MLKLGCGSGRGSTVGRRRTSFIALIFLSSAVMISYCTGAAQPVYKAGFEFDSDSDGVADGWAKYDGGDGSKCADAAYSLNFSDKKEGISSQSVATAVSGIGIASPHVNNLIPGRIYNISFRLKVLEGGVSIDGEGRLYTFHTGRIGREKAGDWVRLSYSKVALPETYVDRITICSDGGGAKFLIDGLSIEDTGKSVLTQNQRSPIPVSNANALSHKKLLKWGEDCPWGYASQHIAEMEKVGFDGILFCNNPVRDSLFNRQTISPDIAASMIQEFKNTKFKRFTDNFLVVSAFGPPRNLGSGWFDDEGWASVLANAKTIARIAKEGGLKGIMYDTEDYWNAGVSCYVCQRTKDQSDRSFSEYAAQARKRGAELIRAINSVYPDATIILTFGTSMAAYELKYFHAQPVEHGRLGAEGIHVHYSLIPQLLDGMIEASTAQTSIVDGFEQSYLYKHRRQLEAGYRLIKDESSALSLLPAGYRGKVKAGFGLRVMGKTPQELEEAFRQALDISDGYVWLWHPAEGNWWEGTGIERDYIEAVLNCQKQRTDE